MQTGIVTQRGDIRELYQKLKTVNTVSSVTTEETNVKSKTSTLKKGLILGSLATFIPGVSALAGTTAKTTSSFNFLNNHGSKIGYGLAITGGVGILANAFGAYYFPAIAPEPTKVRVACILGAVASGLLTAAGISFIKGADLATSAILGGTAIFMGGVANATAPHDA